jgi:hypothetical protein
MARALIILAFSFPHTDGGFAEPVVCERIEETRARHHQIIPQPNLLRVRQRLPKKESVSG